MGMHDLGKYAARHNLARRGRPRTASDEVREAGYKDEKGNYALTGGLKPWHERIVDFMLLNPNAKIVDIARSFGVTPQWIGQLIKTDAFVAYYKDVMAEQQGHIHTTIVAKSQGVAIKALDKMAEVLDKEDVSFGVARDSAKLALEACGFIGNRATGVNVNMGNGQGQTVSITVGKSVFEEARERILARQKENSEKQQFDGTNYQHVTSSMEIQGEAREIEDAVILGDDDSGG